MSKNLNAIIVRSKWTKAFDFPLSFTILFSTNISIFIQERITQPTYYTEALKVTSVAIYANF